MSGSPQEKQLAEFRERQEQLAAEDERKTSKNRARREKKKQAQLRAKQAGIADDVPRKRKWDDAPVSGSAPKAVPDPDTTAASRDASGPSDTRAPLGKPAPGAERTEAARLSASPRPDGTSAQGP